MNKDSQTAINHPNEYFSILTSSRLATCSKCNKIVHPDFFIRKNRYIHTGVNKKDLKLDSKNVAKKSVKLGRV